MSSELLPGAALTAEEKLLVYYRPLDYKTVQEDDFFKAHLTQDGQVRRKGEKTVLLRKKNLLDYEPKSRNPLGPIYLRNSFSLKGLPPGDYEYDIILRDENEPSPPAIQSLKFRVVAPVLPEPSKEAKSKSRRPEPARLPQSDPWENAIVIEAQSCLRERLLR